MSQPQKIDLFLARIRNRLNQFRLFDSFFWSLALAAALLAVACIAFVSSGHAVPRPLYPIALLAVIGATALSWVFRRYSERGAAHFADEFFDLKDSLSSSLSFREEHREGEFIDLQEQSTTERIAPLDPAAVRYQWPRRVLYVSLALVLFTGLMGFKKASPAVLEKQRVEAETASKTGEINDFLEDLVDELEKSGDDEELAGLDPEELRKWVAGLETTRDRKEALRQYAELERKVNEAARRLEQRKNEQLLSRAGEELQKDADNRQLGHKLEEKQYREAARDLAAMKPAETAPEKLSEQKKELARLRSAARRMASAARAGGRQGASSQRNGDRNSRSSESNGSSPSKSSSKSGNSSGESGGSSGENSLEGEMVALEDSLKKFEDSLSRALEEQRKTGQCSGKSLGDCQHSRKALLSDIDRLSRSLSQCQSRRDSRLKLLSMCKKMGQCQGYLCQSECSSLGQCMGTQPGGKKAGRGSVESRRDESDPLVDNGNTTQLRGIQGSGPSLSTVEAADEGSGVSSRRAGNRQREFSRQIESFVQREDVPEDVKRGVKEYFENIHRQ